MKNLYIIIFTSLVLTFSNISFAQKIEVINHGQDYLEIKEMTFYDFKERCKGTIDITETFLGRGGIIFSSEFPAYLLKIQNDKYSLEDFEEFNNLIDEFRKISGSYNYLYNDFLECGEESIKSFSVFSTNKSNKEKGKNAFEYLKLYFQKFEIVCDYYKKLHNYNIDKQDERMKIANNTEKVSNSIETDKSKSKEKIHNDSKLNKLIADKRKALNEVSNSFDNKIEQVELQKQSEIKGLQMSNYDENKRKVVNKYKPKISALKEQKEKDIQSEKLFWDDKISYRKKEVEKIIESEITDLEKTKVQMQYSQREEIKSQHNLTRMREEIETNYQNALAEINEKIRVLLEK